MYCLALILYVSPATHPRAGGGFVLLLFVADAEGEPVVLVHGDFDQLFHGRHAVGEPFLRLLLHLIGFFLMLRHYGIPVVVVLLLVFCAFGGNARFD